MKADELEPTYQNNTSNIIQTYQRSESRKPTITLSTLNKLKKMRAAKDLENLMRGDFLEIIYGMQDDQSAGGGF